MELPNGYSDNVRVTDVQQPAPKLIERLGLHWDQMKDILVSLYPDDDPVEKLANIKAYVSKVDFDAVDRWTQHIRADEKELIDFHLEFAVHFGVLADESLSVKDRARGWGQLCRANYHLGVLSGRIQFGPKIQSKRSVLEPAVRKVVLNGGKEALKQQVLVRLAGHDWSNHEKPKNLDEMIDAIKSDLAAWMTQHDLTRPGLNSMSRAVKDWANKDSDFEIQLQELKSQILS